MGCGAGRYAAAKEEAARLAEAEAAAAAEEEARVAAAEEAARRRALYQPCWLGDVPMPPPPTGSWRQADDDFREWRDATMPIPEWLKEPRCPHWTDATTPEGQGLPLNTYKTMLGLYFGTLNEIPAKDERIKVGSVEFPRPVATHGGNRQVPPEEWGIEAQQFAQFLNSCKKSPEWQDLREATGYGGKRGHVSGYDVCEHFVVPYTKGTGSGVALTLNPSTPRKAQFMISHAWGEDMDEVLLCLARLFCSRTEADLFSEHFPGLPPHTMIPTDAVIWFCIFSNYQCGGIPGDVGPTVAEQLTRDPFGSVIRCGIYHMLVFETSSVFVHDRLWCIYEVVEALGSEIQVKTIHANSHRNVVAKSAKMPIDSAAAKCGVQADQDMITAHIQELGGFEVVNEKITHFRKLERNAAFQRRLKQNKGMS